MVNPNPHLLDLRPSAVDALIDVHTALLKYEIELLEMISDVDRNDPGEVPALVELNRLLVASKTARERLPQLSECSMH